MSYYLPTKPRLLSHFTAAQPMIHDTATDRQADDDNDDAMTHIAVEARIRSGDYFITLATELEKLAELLGTQSVPESDYLERLSAELVYLDKHYALQSKRLP